MRRGENMKRSGFCRIATQVAFPLQSLQMITYTPRHEIEVFADFSDSWGIANLGYETLNIIQDFALSGSERGAHSSIL